MLIEGPRSFVSQKCAIVLGSSTRPNVTPNRRELLFEENLGKVNGTILADPNADRRQVEIRREDVCTMARAIHPAVNARGDRIYIAVRIGQVLTNHSPLYCGFLNPLFDRTALGIVMREKLLFSHSPAVFAGDRQKLLIGVEPWKPVSPAKPVHFLQALLFERFNLQNARAGDSRP